MLVTAAARPLQKLIAWSKNQLFENNQLIVIANEHKSIIAIICLQLAQFSHSFSVPKFFVDLQKYLQFEVHWRKALSMVAECIPSRTKNRSIVFEVASRYLES